MPEEFRGHTVLEEVEGDHVMGDGMQSKERNLVRPEEAIAKLRHIDVLMARGISENQAIATVGATPQAYRGWRKKFNGVRLSRVKLLSVLEAENAQLRRAVVDLALETLVLRQTLPKPGTASSLAGNDRE